MVAISSITLVFLHNFGIKSVFFHLELQLLRIEKPHFLRLVFLCIRARAELGSGVSRCLENGWFLLAKETSCGHVVSCSCSCLTMYISDAACGFASSFFHCQAGETIVQKTITELGLRYESCKVQLASLGWFFEMIFQKASTASRIIPRLCGRISLQKQFCQNIVKKGQIFQRL